MDVLIFTFGCYKDTIFNALSMQKYDLLILIVEEGTQDSEEYSRLMKFEQNNPNKPITYFVDPYDFEECLGILEKIVKKYEGKTNLTINISGATKLLSLTSIICAFNHGIPANLFSEKGMVRLPIFNGLNIFTMLKPEQYNLLVLAKKNIPWKTYKRSLNQKDLGNFIKLRKLGLLTLNDSIISLSTLGQHYLSYIDYHK